LSGHGTFSRYCPKIALQELRKIRENVREYGQCTGYLPNVVKFITTVLARQILSDGHEDVYKLI